MQAAEPTPDAAAAQPTSEHPLPQAQQVPADPEFVCSLPLKNRALFSKGIVCLSKVAEEIFVETLPNQIIFRGVNGSKSAFFCISFCQGFFESYQVRTPCKCKIVVKHLISALKTSQSAEGCWLQITGGEEARFVVIFRTKEGITKVSRIVYEEAEPLRALFSRNTPCRLACEPRIFDMSTFVNIEELRMQIEADALSLSSYLDERQSTDKRVIHTAVALRASNFQHYEVPSDGSATQVTFCLKEFKALLLFLTALGQQMTVNVNAAGRPIIFSTSVPEIIQVRWNQALIQYISRLYPSFQADFVLATLDPQKEALADLTPRAECVPEDRPEGSGGSFISPSVVPQVIQISSHSPRDPLASTLATLLHQLGEAPLPAPSNPSRDLDANAMLAVKMRDTNWSRNTFTQHTPASRLDVLNLEQSMNEMLTQCQGPKDAAKEREIYEQVLAELIRQVTVGCVARGRLLERVVSRYSILSDRIPDLATRLTDAERQLEDREARIHRLQAEAQDALDRLRAVEENHGSSASELEELRHEVDVTKHALQYATQERDEAAQRASKESSLKIFFEEDNASMLKRCNTYVASIINLRTDLESKLRMLIEHEAALADLRHSQMQLQKQLLERDMEVSRLSEAPTARTDVTVAPTPPLSRRTRSFLVLRLGAAAPPKEDKECQARPEELAPPPSAPPAAPAPTASPPPAGATTAKEQPVHPLDGTLAKERAVFAEQMQAAKSNLRAEQEALGRREESLAELEARLAQREAQLAAQERQLADERARAEALADHRVGSAPGPVAFANGASRPALLPPLAHRRFFCPPAPHGLVSALPAAALPTLPSPLPGLSIGPAAPWLAAPPCRRPALPSPRLAVAPPCRRPCRLFIRSLARGSGHQEAGQGGDTEGEAPSGDGVVPQGRRRRAALDVPPAELSGELSPHSTEAGAPQPSRPATSQGPEGQPLPSRSPPPRPSSTEPTAQGASQSGQASLARGSSGRPARTSATRDAAGATDAAQARGRSDERAQGRDQPSATTSPPPTTAALRGSASKSSVVAGGVRGSRGAQGEAAGAGAGPKGGMVGPSAAATAAGAVEGAAGEEVGPAGGWDEVVTEGAGTGSAGGPGGPEQQQGGGAGRGRLGASGGAVAAGGLRASGGSRAPSSVNVNPLDLKTVEGLAGQNPVMVGELAARGNVDEAAGLRGSASLEGKSESVPPPCPPPPPSPAALALQGDSPRVFSAVGALTTTTPGVTERSGEQPEEGHGAGQVASSLAQPARDAEQAGVAGAIEAAGPGAEGLEATDAAHRGGGAAGAGEGWQRPGDQTPAGESSRSHGEVDLLRPLDGGANAEIRGSYEDLVGGGGSIASASRVPLPGAKLGGLVDQLDAQMGGEVLAGGQIAGPPRGGPAMTNDVDVGPPERDMAGLPFRQPRGTQTYSLLDEVLDVVAATQGRLADAEARQGLVPAREAAVPIEESVLFKLQRVVVRCYERVDRLEQFVRRLPTSESPRKDWAMPAPPPTARSAASEGLGPAPVMSADAAADRVASPRPSLPVHVWGWVSQRYGLRALVEQMCWDIFNSMRSYAERNLEVMLFQRFLEEEHTLDQLSFFLYVRGLCCTRAAATETSMPPFVALDRAVEIATTVFARQTDQDISLFHGTLEAASEPIPGGATPAPGHSPAAPSPVGAPPLKSPGARGPRKSPRDLPAGSPAARLQQAQQQQQQQQQQSPQQSALAPGSNRRVPTVNFLQLCLLEYTEQRKRYLERILRLFRTADTDRDGEVNCDEFVVIVSQAVPQWTPDEIKAIFRNVTTAAQQPTVDFRLFGRMVDEYEFFRRCFTLPTDPLGGAEMTDAQMELVLSMVSKHWLKFEPAFDGLMRKLRTQMGPDAAPRFEKVRELREHLVQNLEMRSGLEALRTYRNLLQSVASLQFFYQEACGRVTVNILEAELERSERSIAEIEAAQSWVALPSSIAAGDSSATASAEVPADPTVAPDETA
ncbi:putative cell cycle checkpoint control protein RAD9A [Paratrimastix pyriformis]|uniref:Cell cycle checkpoint control protein RAD9A n=1 Tax=Paratrimastix pyriformis TaxID=342808 RepID=A0ABQ8UKD4_9EUKA|nr:putative cell cycle checkpoint control protein RAD9A [Paratrimastix pyriformis]